LAKPSSVVRNTTSRRRAASRSTRPSLLPPTTPSSRRPAPGTSVRGPHGWPSDRRQTAGHGRPAAGTGHLSEWTPHPCPSGHRGAVRTPSRTVRRAAAKPGGQRTAWPAGGGPRRGAHHRHRPASVPGFCTMPTDKGSIRSTCWTKRAASSQPPSGRARVGRRPAGVAGPGTVRRLTAYQSSPREVSGRRLCLRRRVYTFSQPFFPEGALQWR